MSKLSENIWFTRKARIQTSERLLSNDNHSQILLVVYSIVNTCLAVVLMKNIPGTGDNADLSLVIMSVIILVTSLFVANKNFKGRGLSLKNHYIELHRLYFDTLDAEDNNDTNKIITLRDKYTELLVQEENHATIDDYVFRVFNEKNLTSRKPTKFEKAIVYSYKSLRFLSLTVLYMSPTLIIYVTFSG